MKNPTFWTLETETADFRTYCPQWAEGSGGRRHLLRLCEELIEGRWEPFIAVLETVRSR